MRPITLYVLVDPRDRAIRYAGVTRTEPYKRLCSHVGQAIYHPERRGTHKDVWIRALHRQGLKAQIVAVGESSEATWRDDEKALIAGLRWMGCPLTNTSVGGEGYVHDFTTDVAARRAAARRANRLLPDGTLKPMYSEAARQAVSERARAQTVSAERREALRQLRLGSKQAPETVEKRAAQLRGRPHSPEHIAKRTAARSATYAARRVPMPTCLDCGTALGKRHSQRCRTCSNRKNASERAGRASIHA